MDEKVIISTEEFENLVEKNAALNILLSALKNAATLDYSGNALLFHDYELVIVFKSLFPSTYANLLTQLQYDKHMEGEK